MSKLEELLEQSKELIIEIETLKAEEVLRNFATHSFVISILSNITGIPVPYVTIEFGIENLDEIELLKTTLLGILERRKEIGN